MWRLSLRNFAVEAVVGRIRTKPISAPLPVSPTAPLFPSQAHQGGSRKCKIRCANGRVQFAVAGGGNPLRAWFFLRNLGQQHPIANTTGPAVTCAHGGASPGKTQPEIAAACKGARPNHVGMAIARHKRAGRIEERDGKLYGTQSTQTEQRAAL